MNFINKTLFHIFVKTLEKNKQFKEIHKGESCYIFGNGSSLKNYDLKLFNDRVSIGCGSLFVHKEIKYIDLKYYYIGHPFFFYHFWKNPYSKKYEKNNVGNFYKRKIHALGDVEFFTSISNYFGLKGDNINYVYHFGMVNKEVVSNDLGGAFSMMSGSLLGMVGLAIYMGFKEITLIGCDYTCTPLLNGYFFDYGRGQDTSPNEQYNRKVVNSISDDVNLNTIALNGKYQGIFIPSISYANFTGETGIYRENKQIISEVDLLELDSLNMPYKIFKNNPRANKKKFT